MIFQVLDKKYESKNHLNFFFEFPFNRFAFHRVERRVALRFQMSFSYQTTLRIDEEERVVEFELQVKIPA